MHTRVIVFDIETIPDLSEQMFDRLKAGLKPRKGTKDEAKKIAQLDAKVTAIAENAALSPLTGQICAIGYATRETRCLTGSPIPPWQVRCLTADVDAGEPDLLRRFSKALYGEREPLFVGFNSRAFDLPFIAARAALHSVEFCPCLPLSDRRSHLDLMDIFPGKLDHWAHRVLGEGKSGDGSDVEQLVIEGRWKELAEYCANDVRLTCALFDRTDNVIRP